MQPFVPLEMPEPQPPEDEGDDDDMVVDDGLD
jgi:hypothetical protein